MSARGIEVRLRKLEARTRQPGMLYFVWGRTDEEIDRILAHAVSHGELGPTDPNVCVLCENEPAPRSGWKIYRQLPEEEKDVLFTRIKQIAGDPRYEKTLPAHQIRQMTDEQLLPIALGRPIPLKARLQ
jgi:hypothetical protein